MFLGQEYEIFDWFIIHFTENNGMAFGIEFGGYLGKALLSIIRIIIIIFGIKYIIALNKKNMPNGALIALGLIIGGALGNIIDSAFYGLIFNDSYNNVASFISSGGYAPFLHGKVVDMLYFPIIDTHVFDRHFIFFRPVFNIADSGITTGIMLILIFYRKLFN